MTDPAPEPADDEFRPEPAADDEFGPEPAAPGADEFRGEADISGNVVNVALSARFEPLEGRYRWAGRAAPHPALTALLREGRRAVPVRIRVEAEGHLGEPDPWGRVRISGAGRPPWHAAPAG